MTANARRGFGLALMCLLLTACQTSTRMGGDSDESTQGSDRRLGSAAWSVPVLYPLNRALDFFDMARFGVNVGPGLGIDARATDAARAAAIYDSSVGVGFQTLRKPPFCVRSRGEMAAGPVRTPPTSPLDWRGDFYDVGVEAHLLLIGGHVFINPKEMLDFLAGWVLRDPGNDDWETAF